ncbi:MAG: hypothetical protein LW875_08560 [Proteobacteria bacterium]|jgi:hypothetical protein|nr:hypothetical protein [Pseudomonadota bacterium]
MSLFNEAVRLGFAVMALLLVAMLTGQPGQSKTASQSSFRQIASMETEIRPTKKEEKQKSVERKKKKSSKRVGSSYEHREDLN